MSTSLFPGQFAPLAGFQQTSVAGTAVALTVPKGAKYALIQAETEDLRWRDDGTDPSATVGMLFPKAQPPLGFVGNLSVVKFIATTGTGTITVSYYS